MSGTMMRVLTRTGPKPAPRVPASIARIPSLVGKPPGGGGGGGGGGAGGGGGVSVRIQPVKMPELKDLKRPPYEMLGNKQPCWTALVVALIDVLKEVKEIAEDEDKPEGVKAKMAVDLRKEVDKAMTNYKNCLTSGGGMALSDAVLKLATDWGQSVVEDQVSSLNVVAETLSKMKSDLPRMDRAHE